MTSSKKPAIGTIFFHPRVQSQQDLESITGCFIGERSPTSLPDALQKHPIPIFYDKAGDAIQGGTKGRKPMKYVFFQIDPNIYPVDVPGKLFWVFADGEEGLENLFKKVSDRFPDEEIRYFAIRIGAFLKRIIWSRDGLPEDRKIVRVTRLLVTVEGQEGKSNISDILFSSREDDGIMQRGLLGMIRDMISLRVREIVIHCHDSTRGLKVLVDGGGRLRVGAYVRLHHLLPFVRVVAEICEAQLLVEVDRPARWEDFNIPPP